MKPYDYTAAEPDFKLKLLETKPDWWRYGVDFPTARPTVYYTNSVHGEYLRPRQGAAKSLAILVHGWGDRSLIPCRLLAKALSKKGIASFVVYLVFHSSRMPAPMREKGLRLSPEEWWQGYQTSVVEVRQIVDWAVKSQRINKKAVIGISLGGTVAAITMGMDSRVDAGVFLVTGGNYENPAWLRGKKDNRDPTAYAQAQQAYARYLAEVAEKGVANVTPPKKSYLTDPMTFAHNLRQRPVMMINALWDSWVPRQATLDLWQACDRPPIRWFPTTHAGIWLLYPLIRRQIADFISSAFRR